MTSYYYALWIPQYKRGIPSVKNRTLNSEDLKDRPDDQSFLVSGEIDEADLSIRLSYKLGDGPSRILLFQKTDITDTGFILYKLDLGEEDNDFLCNALRVSMPKAIYHYLKGFFHKHEFHDTDNDSLLEAYFSTVPIDIRDAESLSHILKVYLQSYINKYGGCVNLCRFSLNNVYNNLRKGIKIEDSLSELNFVIENNKIVLDGESLYCDFLISSYIEQIDTVQVKHIYDLRNELAHYDERLHQIESSISSESSIKIGRIGLLASIVGAFVGVAFSLLLSKCSSSELQDSVSTIRKDIQQIQSSDTLVNNNLLILRQQQDSCLKMLHKRHDKNK